MQSRDDQSVRVRIEDFYIRDSTLDLTWVDEVEGLKTVLLLGLRLEDVEVGRAEIEPHLVGRGHVVIVGCAHCGSLCPPGSETCPVEQSVRCVMIA